MKHKDNPLPVLMRHYNLSQKEAAHLMGVRQSTISYWLNGKREIPGPALLLIDIYLVHHKIANRRLFDVRRSNRLAMAGTF